MKPTDLHELLPRAEITRRGALQLIGGGIAALSAGCLSRAGDEEIVPLAREPEHRPGRIVTYASTLVLDGFATGIVVDTHEGRPTKIDGNPAHPASLGGSTPWMQARILDLYDPQRLAAARLGGEVTSWQAIAQRLREGEVWIAMPPQSSPSIARLLDRLRARVHVVECAAIDHRRAYAGAQLVYGTPLEVQVDLARADVVLSLDADFTARPAWARAMASRRTPDDRMSRMWICEPCETPTGTLADERIALPAADVVLVAIAIVDALAARGLDVPQLPAAIVTQANKRLGDVAPRVRALAEELATKPSAILVGDRQPPIVHALARWIDHACGQRCSTLTEPALLSLGTATLADLAAAARAGAPVIAIDCDPVYIAPSLHLAGALGQSRLSLHVGLFANATTRACHGSVPLAHDLEAWSDARAYDGTLSIVQPLVQPRFGAASMIDVLAALVDDPRDTRAIVREGFPDDASWTEALRTGVVAGSKAATVDATPRWPAGANEQLVLATAIPQTIEVALAPSPSVYDGRFAPNAWLQELPHPITKQTWGNAALVAPATAEELGIVDGDALEIATTAGNVVLPALVVPGAARGSITVELGYGQRGAPIADRIGGDAFALRVDDSLILRATVRRVARGPRAIRTQTEFGENGREIAPVATRGSIALAHLRGEQPSLLPAQERTGTQWGMSIDTSICTGCSACMVACQAENNIPSVGAEQVARGRHMNWLRIDRYVTEHATVNQPMPCQHCENAPCEYVCPVNATTHSPDGINEQVYNRCVGTRFCSNNCPYKVRRFNWFTPEPPSTRALQFNPDVTVRSRGVMEKCTYCVQRIRRAEHTAIVEGREVRAGEVTTACQQACPTGAIQFGELHEQNTRFAAMRRDARRFDALHDLGTRPRTQYLARIVNPRGGK